ncbi:3-deoxy-D-manno-octulosonic acid transferase [Flavobacteriaceae bacterium LMO-SS05]
MPLSLIYNIGIYIAGIHLKIIALFNHKIKLGVDGRSQTFNKLKEHIQSHDAVLWFHCASLGEYEQGLPVFKVLRAQYKTHKIVLTFFSPSGYEIRKHTNVADVVVYLPLDTKHNAKRFLDIVHPKFTVFVKYDIWPNYLNALKKRQLLAILISASFRISQSYFKFYGSGMRKALSAFEHIFVQNESSKVLLKSIHINNVTVSGDTRYDRVSQQLEQDNTLDFISEFKQDKLCLVIGSSWPEDEELLVKYINETHSKDVKYIIAPHNIKPNQIENLSSNLQPKTLLFSEKENKNSSEYSVFIIDTIGLLSKIYSYSDIAYVGGGMGTKGLHNILEPAVFGVPIVIGKQYQKFPEAIQMIQEAGVTPVRNYLELKSTLDTLFENKTERQRLGELNKTFVDQNKGAVKYIIDFIKI